MRERFHIAIPVQDLKAAAEFYEGVLGCGRGRSSDTWADFDFRGHQLSVHLKPEACTLPATNGVDGDSVPVRHFGVIFDLKNWDAMIKRLEEKNVPFLIGPKTRFVGEVGEQRTCFIQDPSGNVIELKGFGRDADVFGH